MDDDTRNLGNPSTSSQHQVNVNVNTNFSYRTSHLFDGAMQYNKTRPASHLDSSVTAPTTTFFFFPFCFCLLRVSHLRDTRRLVSTTEPRICIYLHLHLHLHLSAPDRTLFCFCSFVFVSFL